MNVDYSIYLSELSKAKVGLACWIWRKTHKHVWWSQKHPATSIPTMIFVIHYKAVDKTAINMPVSIHAWIAFINFRLAMMRPRTCWIYGKFIGTNCKSALRGKIVLVMVHANCTPVKQRDNGCLNRVNGFLCDRRKKHANRFIALDGFHTRLKKWGILRILEDMVWAMQNTSSLWNLMRGEAQHQWAIITSTRRRGRYFLTYDHFGILSSQCSSYYFWSFPVAAGILSTLQCQWQQYCGGPLDSSLISRAAKEHYPEQQTSQRQVDIYRDIQYELVTF